MRRRCRVTAIHGIVLSDRIRTWVGSGAIALSNWPKPVGKVQYLTRSLLLQLQFCLLQV